MLWFGRSLAAPKIVPSALIDFPVILWFPHPWKIGPNNVIFQGWISHSAIWLSFLRLPSISSTIKNSTSFLWLGGERIRSWFLIVISPWLLFSGWWFDVFPTQLKVSLSFPIFDWFRPGTCGFEVKSILLTSSTSRWVLCCWISLSGVPECRSKWEALL